VTVVLVLLIVVMVIVGAFFGYKSRLTGTASSEDSAEWEQRLTEAAGEARHRSDVDADAISGV
jgi:hypothetical protein